MQNTMIVTPESQDFLLMLKEAKQQIKIWEKTAGEIKDRLVNEFFNRCEAIVRNDGFVLADYKLQTRTTVDTQRLEKELPDVFIEYIKKTEFRTLNIKI